MLSVMRSKLLLAAALLAVASTALAQDSDDAWRGSLRSLLYTDHKLPALEAKTWSSFSPMPGVLAERVTYSTDAGMIVPAVLYRPDPKTAPVKGKLPAVVVVNGHGQDKFGWYAFYTGLQLAKAGAVVLTYDPIGEGERNADRKSMQSPSPHDKDVTPPAPWPKDDWGQRLAGLMQIDLYQALRYVAQRPEVDTTRIGVVGYSMGAFISGIAGAALYPYSPQFPEAPHFKALVLSGGGTYDDDTGYFDLNHNPCQGPPYRSLKPWLQIDGKPARGFILFYLNAERGPTLVMNGTNDTVMDIAHHDAAWFDALRARELAAAGSHLSRENIFTSLMYPGVSHRPSWVNLDGVEWLNKQLHFAFWNTDAKIAAQSTTHISEWITANHVAISPNYFREDREGGILAVGKGIPALTREQLTVLPEADWQRMKDRLTYEAWAEKTLDLERTTRPGAHVH
jgi:dienelactone hydrolase